MFHFGYGSNLSTEFVHKELIPNAKYVMKAYLPNFEVRFPFWSPEKEAGYSGIMEAPGELVHGVLYEVTEEDLTGLDNMERVYKDRYKRMTYRVLGEDGKFHLADLYRVIDPQGPFPPSREYVDIMLKGARELGLDAEYIRKIEGFYDLVQA